MYDKSIYYTAVSQQNKRISFIKTLLSYDKNVRPGALLRWYALKSILCSEMQEDSMVLDIGSYDGFIDHKLRITFSQLTIIVVDIDKSGLQTAKAHNLRTVQASALELPIAEDSVDMVLCLDLLEHVHNDDQLLKEITRVLKIGGKIILSTPMQYGVSFPFMNKEECHRINVGWGHVRNGYSLETLRRLFHKHQLHIERTSAYFNWLSRLVYRWAILSPTPFRGKHHLYNLVIKTESYFKLGAQEHIIIGKKV